MGKSISLHKATRERLQYLINEGMGYRTRKEIVDFFIEVGYESAQEAAFTENLSRNEYTDYMLSKINGNLYMEKCLQELFNLRYFIDQEEFLDEEIKKFNKILKFDGWEIIRQEDHVYAKELLAQLPMPSNPNRSSDSVLTDGVRNNDENEFLSMEFSEIPVENLGFDSAVIDIIKQRIDEIKVCFKKAAYFSAVIMIGGTLEGILSGYFMQNPEEIESSIKEIEEMSLATLLQNARKFGLISENTHKFGRAVKDFRNYIHPSRQLKEGFTPDQNTAKISLIVLQSVITEIAEKKKSSK